MIEQNYIGKLIESAVAASEKAYSIYSKFNVGAALLTADYKTFTGANIENASYSATACAERNAVSSAVFGGYTDFSAMAIYTPNECRNFVCCGVCLQVLSEFCKQDFEIYCVSLNIGRSRKIDKYTLGQLLPASFSLFEKNPIGDNK